MKTVCPSCSGTYDVPDEKLRASKSMRMKCPGCDSFITINSPGSDAALSSLPSYDGMPEGTPTTTGILDETQTLIVPPPTADMDTVGAHLEDEMEALAEGALRALIADKGNLDLISPILRKMGYLITAAESVGDALTKLRFNFYNLIVVNERFDGSDPTNNALHKYLETLNMGIRRSIFILLIGKNFKSLNNMTALMKSVNLVLSESDFSNFELILKKSMNDNDTFYRAFKRALVESDRTLE